MKVSITKEELLRTLSVVSKGMSSRSTLPILSGILISAEGKTIVLQTTDLEISIKSKATAFIEEPGQIVVPGKLFNEIIRSFPDAAIQLSLEGERIRIECLSSSFVLNTLNPSDFPRFPEVNTNQTVTLSSNRLAAMVKRVSKAVSKDETRVVLTGIFFTIHEDRACLAATDSYRLAVSEEILPAAIADSFEVIVPGRIFEEIVKSASSEDEISISISENQILFSFGTTLFVTRKIEGNYPNYRQLISTEKNTSATVNTSNFISAVKRVALLAQTQTAIKLSFSVNDQAIKISSQAQDVGGAEEVVSAEIVGEDNEIGFNHQYIVDGLSSISSEETLVEIQSSLKPGIFRAVGGENSLYLAMPVRLG